ncbi:MAG: ABC transporter permease [Chloroflexi bacterium]|nr:ABC transporter permease [Chloroflexota bacterium]
MAQRTEPLRAIGISLPAWVRGLARPVAMLALVLLAFGVVLLIAGKDPLRAYADVFGQTLGTPYGISEVLVRMIPLILTAVAVAIPARLGLINIGGEGQFYMGAWLATWGAITFGDLPAWLLLPLMCVLGMIGGGVWAAMAGFLRAKGWVNETISTLLLNYVAPLVTNFFIFGPWRSPDSGLFPVSKTFVAAARLPTFGGTRVTLGIVLALCAVVLFWFVTTRTRWGLEMRAIGGNSEAARRLGIPLPAYILLALFAGGALAGLAGMAEVSGMHGRLIQVISPGYGFMGFLISWLAGGNALGIIVMSFLLAVIASGGTVLQLTQGLPYAIVNILMALILFIVLARPMVGRK